MSNAAGFYLVGRKGHYVLAQFLQRFGPEAVDFVIAGRDSGLADDGFDAIRDLAAEHGLEFAARQPQSGPRSPSAAIEFAIGWKWLLQADRNLVVLHDSLLPRYRGFAPVVNSLIAGDTRLGITALRAVEDYDAGPIVAQAGIDIEYPLTIAAAIDLLCPLYAELVSSVYEEFQSSGDLKAEAQQAGLASYSPWLDELDYRIPWERSAAYVRRFCDAVGSPYRGALTYWQERAIRVIELAEVDDVEIVNRSRHVGKVIRRDDGLPIVICGEGLVRVEKAVFDNDRTNALDGMPLRVRFADVPMGGARS